VTPIENLLAKLPGAKKTSNGWSARANLRPVSTRQHVNETPADQAPCQRNPNNSRKKRGFVDMLTC